MNHLATYFKKMFLKSEDIFTEVQINKIMKSIKPKFPHECPKCNSKCINRNGKTKLKKQRYICKSCGKSFSETTGSPFMYSKKPLETWIKYIFCIKENLPLRDTSRLLGINLSTSFYWRHKILSVVGEELESPFLSNVIELHELKLKENFKGNHSKKLLPPLNERDSILILSSKDSFNNSFFKPSCKNVVTREILDDILAPIIKNGKILGTPRNPLYIRFAKDNNLQLSMYGSLSYLRDDVNLGNARKQSIDFKRFLYVYSGVASKYLSYYINLFILKSTDVKNLVKEIFNKLLFGVRQLKISSFNKIQFDGVLKAS
ncbi:IS1 family transposase [Clostridium paridis]|uniref:IS1 family transposase n=1 Tax=Clostridium paridis TaxID=2803863 RepID=A0A937K472_9CLOT|nr:IS1 family transposase [Clostridium paridis]MBL4931243.1 IS1 family transposase [Clostridium paridis]